MVIDNLEEKRRSIEGIYRAHGFVVDRWDEDLKCHVVESCELHSLSDVEVTERIERAWCEIDRVIHNERCPRCQWR